MGPAADTFVTQLSSIVGVTETLPGLHTAAVNTAGMRDTLITVLPLPAIQTPDTHTHTLSYTRKTKTGHDKSTCVSCKKTFQQSIRATTGEIF